MATSNNELYRDLEEVMRKLAHVSQLLDDLPDDTKDALQCYFPAGEDVASLVKTSDQNLRALVSKIGACDVIFDGDEKSLKHIEKPYKADSFCYDKDHQHEKVIFVPKADHGKTNSVQDALTSAHFVWKVKEGTDDDELQETAAALFAACEKEHPDKLIERHGIGFFRPTHDNDDTPSQ